MKHRTFGQLEKVILALGVIALLAVGCTKRYVITDELYAPLPEQSVLSIGAIVDDLPMDMTEDEKPTAEHISMFKSKLLERIEKKDIFSAVSISNDSANYILRGSITEYKEGSGLMRALIGFGAGSSKLAVTLEMRDARSGQLVFGGNYTGQVSDWGVKGEKMFDSIAKDFAKSLDKALKQQKKNAN